MVQLRNSLLRKRSSVAKLLCAVVAMVTISSIAMLSLIQHDEDFGSQNIDYNFDLKNGISDTSLNKKIEMIKEGVNLRMRDTLALPDDYGYNLHNEQFNPKPSSNKIYKPLQKVYENQELKFEIQRDKALIEKENHLRKLRTKNRDVILEPIRDEDIESNGDYSYDSEENENPEFQPGDFDIPDNVKDIKVKFDTNQEEINGSAEDDGDDYYDDNDDYSYDENDTDDENEHENELSKTEKRIILDKFLSDKYEPGDHIPMFQKANSDAQAVDNYERVNGYESNDHDPVAMAAPQFNGGKSDSRYGERRGGSFADAPLGDQPQGRNAVSNLLDSAAHRNKTPPNPNVMGADAGGKKAAAARVSNTDLLDSAMKRADVKAASNRNTVRSDPCQWGDVNCGGRNEPHTVGSNADPHADMPQNNQANLAAAFRHSHHQRENNTNAINMNKSENLNEVQGSLHLPLDTDKSVVDNALYKNQIETQIPMQDRLGNAVAMDFPATQLQPQGLRQERVDVLSRHGMPIIVNKVYWSEEALDLVPKGIQDEDIQLFLTRISQQPISVMQPPLWNKCGRPKNQYVELTDGLAMCARYRLPHSKFVQGEILSFYLSRLLGMDNVPPVVLAHVHSNSSQWKRVATQMREAEWVDDSLVALILWIDNIDSHERMPSVILEAFTTKSTFNYTNPSIASMTSLQLSDVIQWTDLVLFDYITGNYDRVASMQDGAESERKQSIIQENIRNLRKDRYSGRLWFIDNESGLLDAYELMYHNRKREPKFLRYHREMLRTICVFNPKTVARIKLLLQQQQQAPHDILVSFAHAQDVLYKDLPHSSSFSLFQSKFHTRLKEVLKWIEKCESQI